MESLLTELLIIFLLSIGVNLACSRFRLPATVGFLLTGVLCGPSLLGLVGNKETVDYVSDLGVAMLMFTIGMELSGDALDKLKRPVFLGGSLQIGLIVAVCGLAGFFMGQAATGVTWGCLYALSSSAIVLKIFQQNGMGTTPVGLLSLAILVFQDIMVAPMMILIPLISGQLQLTPASVAIAVAKVAGLGAAMYLVSRFVLDRLMEAVVRTRAREVVLLTTLCLCLGAAMLTHVLGMSLSLGAFLSGLMMARSRYSMSVIADILPYRDVFMSLFFISVGMMLDISFVLHDLPLILAIVATFLVAKPLLTLPAVLVQGYPLATAIRTSLCLAQVGEFSFVLAASALGAGLLDANGHQLFLAISVITMMLTPGIIAVAPGLGTAIARGLHRFGCPGTADVDARDEGADSGLSDHIIIVGFGFSGRTLARTAKECGLAYTAIDMNPETVSRYEGREPIMYGDATQPVILEHLGVEKARVLAIVISDPAAARAIVTAAHQANPQLIIIVRSRFVTEIEPLHELGASHVIAEEFESSIEVFSQVLTAYLVPRQDIDRLCDSVRRNNYRAVRRFHRSAERLKAITDHIPDVWVHSLRLDATSQLAGQSLAQCQLRTRYGVTVVAANRAGQDIASPDGDFVLTPGDILYVFGDTDKLYAIKPVLSGVAAAKGRKKGSARG